MWCNIGDHTIGIDVVCNIWIESDSDARYRKDALIEPSLIDRKSGYAPVRPSSNNAPRVPKFKKTQASKL